jgi:hypothetical protein
MSTLDQAEAEARRMIGDVSVVEYSQLLTRQAAGRTNRVYNGELPPRRIPKKLTTMQGLRESGCVDK